MEGSLGGEEGCALLQAEMAGVVVVVFIVEVSCVCVMTSGVCVCVQMMRRLGGVSSSGPRDGEKGG